MVGEGGGGSSSSGRAPRTSAASAHLYVLQRQVLSSCAAIHPEARRLACRVKGRCGLRGRGGCEAAGPGVGGSRHVPPGTASSVESMWPAARRPHSRRPPPAPAPVPSPLPLTSDSGEESDHAAEEGVNGHV